LKSFMYDKLSFAKDFFPIAQETGVQAALNNNFSC